MCYVKCTTISLAHDGYEKYQRNSHIPLEYHESHTPRDDGGA